MKIGIVSDLHLEFHRDGGGHLISILFTDGDPDVLVVAGDLTLGSKARGAFKLLRSRFPEIPILFVAGNHEFYQSSFGATYDALQDAAAQYGISYLHRDVVVIRGQRFVGATLWFERSDVRDRINDFRLIKDFEPRVYEECRANRWFLREHVREGDVVITHHLPSYRSVAEHYRGAPSNAFFVCDIEPLILERQPALWVHGHTHDACGYRLGETRVVCNPLGYPHELGGGFDPCKVVEV